MLVLTCTLVSVFHGSNDAQKGMGLIMLILVGIVPGAFALNMAHGPEDGVRALRPKWRRSSTVFTPLAQGRDACARKMPSSELTSYIKQGGTPATDKTCAAVAR